MVSNSFSVLFSPPEFSRSAGSVELFSGVRARVISIPILYSQSFFFLHLISIPGSPLLHWVFSTCGLRSPRLPSGPPPLGSSFPLCHGWCCTLLHNSIQRFPLAFPTLPSRPFFLPRSSFRFLFFRRRRSPAVFLFLSFPCELFVPFSLAQRLNDPRSTSSWVLHLLNGI